MPSDPVAFPDANALQAACAPLASEGIVAKRKDSQYRSGPRCGLIKMKNAERKAAASPEAFRKTDAGLSYRGRAGVRSQLIPQRGQEGGSSPGCSSRRCVRPGCAPPVVTGLRMICHDRRLMAETRCTLASPLLGRTTRPRAFHASSL